VGSGTDFETFTLDQDDTGGDVALQFGTTLNETLAWNSTNLEFELSNKLNINQSGEAIEFGEGLASDIFINFNNGSDHNFGWDNSQGAFSTFNEELEFKTLQSSNPPQACSSTIYGMQWMDTDTGILYVCDTSNSRNKWLSVAEYQISGGETAVCAAGDAPSVEACTQDVHNGTNANDMGYLVPRDITIVGGSFHSDVSCTDGSGVDLEVAAGENGAVAYLGDIFTGCTDANGCSRIGQNLDVDANEIIRARLDNNCASGNVNDWSSLILFRYRHD